MNATMKLEQMFDIGETKTPVFKELTQDTYRQLESGIYNTWGRRMNIDVRKYNDEGIWEGEYKDWSHLQEITVRDSYFEYLNANWLFLDLRPNKVFKYWCKEAYIFDVKVIVIQQIDYDRISAKILTDNEELKLHIEDILEFKPMNIVPRREVREINDLEYQGLEFGSSQLKINMNTAEEQLDEQGLVISNLDHYDNYVYEVYDSLRNIFKHISKQQLTREAEAQCIWLEEWLQKPLTNEMDAIVPYMTDEVTEEFKKYLYQNKNMRDREACGSYLYKETKIKEFSIDDMDYIIRDGTKMEDICKDLDIPITIGWDIWKLLNFEIMDQIVQELYEEYPL